jgi:flagellar protein FliO/FliZ
MTTHYSGPILVVIIAMILTIATIPLSAQEEKKGTEEGTFIIDSDAANTTNNSNTPNQTKPAAEKPVELVPIWDFIRMILILAAVIGVIYLFFFFLKKGVKKRMPESELIRVLGFVSLQRTQGLYLVELGNNIYLIGSGENGLSLISQVTDKETIDIVRLHASETVSGQKLNFSDLLMKMFKPKDKKQDDIVDPIDFLKKQQERIKNMK